MSEDRQHLLFLHRLTPLSHQLLLSWFVPYLSSLVGQHPNEVTSLIMSCDSHTAYITSRSRFLITVGAGSLSLEAAFLGRPLPRLIGGAQQQPVAQHERSRGS